MTTLSTTERDRLCCEAISTYLFDKVWNEPVSEYRHNFKPEVLRDRSTVGSVSINGNAFLLPTTATPYYLWRLDTDTVNIQAECPQRVWLSLNELCTKYKVNIDIYGSDGSMFHKGTTFVMYIGDRQALIIAARKQMIDRIMPAPIRKDVYMTFYYDSDVPNDVEMLSIATDSSRRLSEQTEEMEDFIRRCDNKDQLLIYKNGWEVTDINHLPSLEAGNYYDFIIDRNIIFSFDVDVYHSAQDPVYKSTRDLVYKQLIHIPKALNPDNKIITHNTCDFFIRKGDISTVEGKYLHRVHKYAVTQVTHNDFGLSLDVLDAYRDYLATELLVIHVVCRQHDKDNVLIRDSCFIDLLYSDRHSDKDIINILCGEGPKQIPWWRADNLEQCKYVEFMFNMPYGNVFYRPEEMMQQYVDALGITPVMNLLCNRIRDLVVTDAFDYQITMATPVMFQDFQTTALVYLNGYLLDSEYVDVDDSGSGEVVIKFDRQLVIRQGDEITVFLYLTGFDRTTRIIPKANHRTVTVPYTKYCVYREDPVTNGVTAKGALYESNVAYVQVFPGANIFIAIDNGDGTTSFTFGEEQDDRTFYIQNTECTHRQEFDLSEYTATGKTIAIPLMSGIVESNDQVPIFNVNNINVYMNHRYLVAGHDYLLHEIKDAGDNFVAYEVIVQTMDYFDQNLDHDTLTIFTHIAHQEDSSKGFSVQDILYDATPVNMYFNQITMAHVNGKLERKIDFKGVYGVLPKDTYPEGAHWEIQTCLPESIRAFVERYATSEEANRITILNEYFAPMNPEIPSPLVLPTAHRIYSTTLNNFINDVLNNKIIAAADPDTAQLAATFAAYIRLKEYDLVFSSIDQRFVDFYPQYVTQEVTTAQRHIIERFVKAFMPENLDPTDEVVYGD